MQPIMMRCFTCGGEFPFGPHRYDGKHIPAYQFTVCSGCYSANWDGWGPMFEEKILKHLEENGLPVPARRGDWLPRDG